MEEEGVSGGVQEEEEEVDEGRRRRRSDREGQHFTHSSFLLSSTLAVPLTSFLNNNKPKNFINNT